MKKIVILAVICLFGASAAKAAPRDTSTTAGLGFDIMGSFYQPSDSRYQGIGSGVNIGIRMDDNLTMGYRVEELNVRAEDAVGATAVTDNLTVVMQGINAFYRTFSGDKLAVDLGLWLGSATTADFIAGATATPKTSPMLEPQGRLVYTSTGRVDTHITLGVGYRFIRKFNDAVPFTGIAGSALKNFDGLDINFGVGLSF